MNKEAVEKLQRDIDKDSKQVKLLIDKLVNKYCSQLDKEMKYAHDIIYSQDNNFSDISDSELEEIILSLPASVYWSSQGLEDISIKQNIAKMIRDKSFIESFNEKQGNIGKKNIEANADIEIENITEFIYDTALKSIKLKQSYAIEMLQSVKKIYSKRINDNEKVYQNISENKESKRYSRRTSKLTSGF